MEDINIDPEFQMYTILEEPEPNKDSMYFAPPESTIEAMEEAGIE